MIIFYKIFLCLIIGILSSFVILTGLRGNSQFSYFFITIIFVLLLAYTFAGKISFLKQSLAYSFSLKSFVEWTASVLLISSFCIGIGIGSAYFLYIILDNSYLVSAEIGTILALLFSVSIFLPGTSRLLLNEYIIEKQPLGERGEQPKVDFLVTLESDINRLKEQGTVLLILCGAIAVYAGFQAAQAIDIVDSRGVSTDAISTIRQRISSRENLLERALQSTDFSSETSKIQYERTAEQLDNFLKNDRTAYQAELGRILSSSQDITGRYIFSYFSSFFVRVASVIISLGFFTILFFQYRRVDRQRAELVQIRLAYLSIKSGLKTEDISNARKALAIRDYVPTRRETDSMNAFGAATIGMVPEIIRGSGIQLRESLQNDESNKSERNTNI